MKLSLHDGLLQALASEQHAAAASALLQALQALLREQQAAFNARCVGLTMPVLITGPGRHPGQIMGRAPYLQPVHLVGPAALIGQEIPVCIAAAHTNSLSGALKEKACA